MEKVKVTMYLAKETAKKFKVFCAETERSYGDWVGKWLKDETAEGRKKTKGGEIKMIEQEMNGLKGMMAVADEKTRGEFLAKWFLSPTAKIIGEDPFRRGEFAREAGMTEEELGEWNKILAGK